MVFDELSSFISSTLSSVLTNVVLASIVLLTGFIAGRIFGKVVRWLLHELSLNKFFNFLGLRVSLEDLIAGIVTFFSYFITLVVALNTLGISELLFNLLAFALSLFILLSIFFTLQNFLPNLFAGIAISRGSLIKRGDHINLSGVEGKVVDITFYHIKIETAKNEVVFVPNNDVMKSKFFRKN